MQTSHKLGLAVALLASATASVSSLAQEQNDEAYDTVELSPFVVTGETYAFGAQKLVHVTSEDLDLIQASDLEDIFSLDPSIQVGGSISAAEKIYVRGIEDKLLTVSIDGATQAGYLSHHQGQFSVEPELLKFAEVEPGAGGAAVGPGALAGTIRFENKGATDFLTEDQDVGAFTKLSYGSNSDEYKVTGALYGNLSSSVSGLFAYTYSDSDDYEDGNGEVVDYTGSETNRAFLKLDALIDLNNTMSFSYEDRSNEGTFRHRPNFSGYFNHPRAPNKPIDMEFSRETATLEYGYENESSNVNFDATLYHTDNSVDRTGQYEMGYESLGLDLKNTSIYGTHTVVYGFNYRDDTASFTGKGQTELDPPFSNILPPLVYNTIPDETIEVIGFFAQDEWQFNDTLQASFGLRWDEYNYEDKDGLAFKDSGLSPNLGISYAASEALDLNISYGAAFRGVTPIDVITANEGTIANHPSVDPEWSNNYEIGFQYSEGNLFANGTLYRQEVNDVIVSASGLRDNGGDLEVDGYDFTFGFKSGDLTSSIGVSHAKPELNGEALVDTANGIGVAYGRAWNAGTSYTFPDLKLAIGWNLNFVEKYDEGDNELAHKASYVVHDLYARWVTGENDNIVIALTVDNAFDKFYVNQATSGYNAQLSRIAGLAEPGRDIRLSASYQF